jgi:hypothetical protein
MQIAIRPCQSSRIRAQVAANPKLTETEIAKCLGILVSTAKLAMSRSGRVQK